jgi:glycosyltransferase involved in cell wall biosynthesis
VVTVSTEPLAEVMRRINPNVRVVPNMVPAALLDLPDVRRTDGVVTVGWAGSHTHAMDFAEIASELVRFFPRNPNCEYHAIGGLFPSMQGLSAKHVRISSWKDNVWDYYRALDFHVSLAPLRPHVFNRSKSPVKALEMAARGIPIVASDVGPYPGFVRHGKTGFLAVRPHEWPKYLRELVDDMAMREEMGAAARSLAAAHTIEGGWQRWVEALQP